MYCDSHVHLQPHGEAPPMTRERIELYVESARAHGVEQIALTEHLFRFREAFELLAGWWQIGGEDPALITATEAYWRDHVSATMADYVRVVEGAKTAGLPVLLGIELDWIPGRADDLRRLLEPYDWDVVLGSVHWIGAWSFDSTGDEIFWPQWELRDTTTTFQQYAGLLSDLASSGLADVLAHPDLPKLAGHRPASYTPLHDAIVRAATDAGCALELNSNGYNKRCQEPYPAPDVLRAAHSARVPITLASDAHRPERVGQRFDDIAAYAERAGYTSYVSFEQRHPIERALFTPSTK